MSSFGRHELRFLQLPCRAPEIREGSNDTDRCKRTLTDLGLDVAPDAASF